MTQTYRTDDLTKWGPGKGSNLTPAEVDINFWDILQRLITQEARPDPSAGIDFFEVVGSLFYVHMTDDTTILGPYQLPYALFNGRGDWLPLTSYAVLDTFTINGGLYAVIFAHTSALSFDPGANDGLGHDYYQLLIQTPGNALPTGGAVGQVVQKSTTTDFAVTWGWKTPTGGTARQYHIKTSATQDDSAWHTPQASDIHFTPATGSALTATTVDAALEEVSTNLGNTSLANLSDVLFATGDPVTDQLLSFDGTKWTGKAANSLALVFTQMTDSPSVSQLRNTTITGLASSGAVSVDPSLGNIFEVTPSGAVTLNAASTPAGAEITIIITTFGTSSYNVSPGTDFVSAGALATGTASGKKFTMKFISNGTKFVEVSRTAALA